jgi:hypothetical protein
MKIIYRAAEIVERVGQEKFSENDKRDKGVGNYDKSLEARTVNIS